MSDSPALPEWLIDYNDHTAPATPQRDRHARTTVGILSAVRTIGIVLFGIGIAIGVLGMVVGTLTADNHVQAFFLSAASTVSLTVFAALWYATFGWFVETLNMLTRIAANTAR